MLALSRPSHGDRIDRAWPPGCRGGFFRAEGVPLGNETVERLRSNIQTVFLGHSNAVDLLLIGLLARGHVLIEDVPGVGKTVLARSLARSIDCRFSRIQLTPDLLPGDVLGVSIYNTL